MGVIATLIITTAIAGVAGTGLGGLVGALLQKDSNRTVSLLLSFAGGVMLSVVCFDLVTEAIATGVGIVWGKDKQGKFLGGWAAEYVEYFDTYIDDDIAKAHAQMWLSKSMKHELELRDVEQHSDFQIFHNFINITQNFAYCLTALGFLNFEFAPIVDVEK